MLHIDYDEVGYDVWQNSKSVQEYMKANNLKTPADLQIDFTNTLSIFIEANRRQQIMMLNTKIF